jgi:NADPH-dependent 2,4-dienoyl-CoA reductase/sulfur reductase-like enzyme
MKRPRTDDSTDLSPRESNGTNGHNGSVDVQMVNGNHDVKVKDSTAHVLVVGAGPGGLMLAYAVYFRLC